MDNQTPQSMDITTLKAVLSDLRKVILPSLFERTQQPEPGTIQVGLRTLQGLIWLEMSWQADAPRLVQIEPPLKAGTESTLAQQIHHVLGKMALVEIKQNGFERIVEFHLARRPGESIQRVLILEIMGRHSNLVLLDSKKKIITLGRQIRNHQSRVRPLSTGDLYISPPCLQGIVPSTKEPFERWKRRLCLLPISLKKALIESYQGISPALALQLAGEEIEFAQNLLQLPVTKVSNKQWVELYNRWCKWLVQIEHEKFNLCFDGPTPYKVWNTKNSHPSSLEKTSLSLGKYYQEILGKKKFNLLFIELQNKLNKLKGNEEKKLYEKEKLLKEISRSTVLQDEANKILSLKSPSSELIDKSQKLYRKAKKLRRSLPVVQERIAHHKQRLQSIEESKVFLNNLNSNQWEKETEKLEGLIELQQELYEYQISTTNRKETQKRINVQKKKTPKPLSIKSPGGLEIQIGRNHRQNDWISLKQSRNGDLWFHVQECPGSHVILKASNGMAEDEDLQMAADLAAYFSNAKGSLKVPVLMVPTHQLQRIPGTAPGTVKYRKSTICWGEPSKGMEHIKAKNS